MTDPIRLEPPVSPLTVPFWEATRAKRLLVQWCVDCQTAVFYPRADCPSCFSTRLEWRESPGVGTVYSVTIEHKPQNPRMAAMAPYTVALVDLDEGVRVLSNVVNAAPDDVAVGMRVGVTWEELSDGRNLPLFQPEKGE